MLRIITALLLIILPTVLLANNEVTFINEKAPHTKCEKKDPKNGKWIKFIQISQGEKRTFKNFKLNQEVRCKTAVNTWKMTDMTHFKPDQYGIYEILQSQVEMTRKHEEGWKQSTIIVFPNGDTYYNDK